MPTWQKIVAGKQARQLASIPKNWLLSESYLPGKEQLRVIDFPESSPLLSALDLEITNSAVDVLLSKLASSKWSAVQVTTSFYKRAIIAHQLTNCLTEIFVDRAIARAAELDAHLARTGKVVGALHGLPISLKGPNQPQGHRILDGYYSPPTVSFYFILDSASGYVSWIDKYAESNAALVDILESLGAVPFVKTNVPQTLMWPETFNHVFGRTTNPHNRSLTSGGSSGGEGALIALKGSPLGVGSDVGGSIRIPAGFCGVYGFRPSSHRVPYAGCVNSLEGQDSVPSVLGPLSNTLSGIKTFFKAVIDAQPWLVDPLVVRKRWSEEEYNLIDHGRGGQLCFAIMWDNGVVVPHPPITRGLQMTKRALVAAGHRVIDWTPLKHAEIITTIGAIWNAGAGEDYSTAAAPSGEPVITSMGVLPPEDAEQLHRPTGYRNIRVRPLAGPEEETRHSAGVLEALGGHLPAVTGTGRPVDAIISPVAAYTAPPHGMNRYVEWTDWLQNSSAQYTMAWNLLDYAALVIPVSKVDQELDVKRPPHKFRTREDQVNYERYDGPRKYANAPICIQVVGRTMEEEAVLAMSAGGRCGFES
ncbi:general amidase [Mycena rebaudengoi]|nr:general amidase [Mycena rebaudengoi]